MNPTDPTGISGGMNGYYESSVCDVNLAYRGFIWESDVGCRVCRVAGGSKEFLVTEGWTDFHFEQSLCEPYRPYRDIRSWRWV